MIQANELRIGNKLQKSDGKIFTVLRLDNSDDVLVEEERSLLTLNYNLFGIPLSPEILEGFGFERGDMNVYYDFYSKGDFEVALHHSKDYVFIKWNEIEIQHATNNLPVHQLQNLYHALTGEELIYKEQL